MLTCSEPEILRVIMYVLQILKIVFIIVPIGLILMIGIDFFKNVTAGKEDEMKKNLNIAIKRIIYCVCLFFVPTIVSLANSILGDLGVDYAECIDGLTIEKIDELINDQAEEAVTNAISSQNMSDVLDAETYVNKMKDCSLKEEYKNTLESIKQKIIDEEKQNQEEDKQNQITPTPGTSDTSGKYLYVLKNPDPEYLGHKVELTDTQYLYVCRALFGERESASYEIYVALAQYIRDHVDAYKLAGTNTKNYDNLGTRWLVSANSDRAKNKTVSWIQENRPEIIKAVDYVFKDGGSFAQGFMEFYVDKYDGSTPEIATNNLISAASQHCQPYGGNYNNHENFTLYPEWGDTSHWFSCSICPWYSGVKGVKTKRTN